jgi:ABC-type transporter Mla subunit MlaD
MNEMEPSRGAVWVSKLILITALLVVLVTLGAAQVSSGEGTHPDNATSTPFCGTR